MLEARLLVLLTDQAGLYTTDPRRHDDAELVAEVTDESQLDRLRDRRAHLALRPGRDAQQGGGRRDGGRLGHRRGDLRRDRRRDPAGRGRAASAGGTRFAPHPRARLELQALAALRQAEPRDACASTTAPRASCARAAAACCRSASPGSRASSRPATPSTSPPTARRSARGSSTTRPASCAGSRACGPRRSASSFRTPPRRPCTATTSC